MPESYRSANPHPSVARRIPTLSKFTAPDMLIRIGCQHCRIWHHYRPSDLLQLCGDIILDEVAAKFRCERCDKKEFLTVRLKSYMTGEMIGLQVRRLVRIKTVCRPVWEDVTL